MMPATVRPATQMPATDMPATVPGAPAALAVAAAAAGSAAAVVPVADQLDVVLRGQGIGLVHGVVHRIQPRIFGIDRTLGSGNGTGRRSGLPGS